MKKLFALSTAFVLTFSCFTGCGDKKESEKENVPSMSVRELNDRAEKIHKVGETVLTDCDERGIDVGGWYYLTSDGECFGGKRFVSEDFIAVNQDIVGSEEGFAKNIIAKMDDYDSNHDETKWIIWVMDGRINEVYTAENFEIDTIGVYPSDASVKDKSLNEIKSELEDKYNDMITKGEMN